VNVSGAPLAARPAAAYLVGLAGLPHMGPRRFRALLAGHEPGAAWEQVRSGRAAEVPEVAETLLPKGPVLARQWAGAARTTDIDALWQAHRDAGVLVLTEDDADYPEAFRLDPEPPAVLFARGALDSLSGACVGVVGTRRCTHYGRDVASELGRDLAAAGVRVVSGLARGIDAAAHAGALSVHGGPPVGVVANGLDVHYPRVNAPLYRQVADRGLLLSEFPLGAGPRTWAFPARNRLVAALARVVVVVESGLQGGSHHTVEAALDRQVAVMAVPGSVRSPASAGTNRLLMDVATPARDSLDVLMALGLDPAPAVPVAEAVAAPATRATTGATGEVPAYLRPLLDAVGWEPSSLEQLLLRTRVTFAELHEALSELEERGLVSWNGNWVERRAASAGSP
jgi:DNA processing protein